MLSKAKMVEVRRAIESLYDGKCSISEYREYQRPNKSIGHREVVVLEGQPCRLSFSSSPAVGSTDTASRVAQTVKLFIAPEVVIKAGSKITVEQNGVSTSYKASGESAMYQNHQEINLELFERWA